jgi:hypothetical protein
VYEVRHAAVQNSTLHAEEEFEGCKFRVTAGDYQELLQKVKPILCLEWGVMVYKKRHAAVHNSKLYKEEECEGRKFRVSSGDKRSFYRR